MNLDDEDDVFDSEDISTLSGPALRMPDPNADVANRQRGKSLETLLVSKNRKLQDDVTNLRVAYDEVVLTSQNQTAELQRAKGEAARLKTLNEKLEEDLTRVQPNASAGINGIANKEGHSTLAGRADPLAGLNLGREHKDPSPIPTASSTPTPGPKSSAETSILPIITNQRDRFRQRNAELEEELRKQFEAITEARGEIKGLQTDNLKLYEKVRYLQSYREEAGGSAHPAVARKDEELAKYRGLYEDHMNPFEKFRGRVRCLH